MSLIEIQSISGVTYPVYVFVSDIYKNNQSLLGVIPTDPYPDSVIYTSQIPQILTTADQILISLLDNNGCEFITKLDCNTEPILQINLTRSIQEITLSDTSNNDETTLPTTKSLRINDSGFEYRIVEEKIQNGEEIQVIEMFEKNSQTKISRIRILINKATKELIGWELVQDGSGTFSYLNKMIRI